MEKWLMEELEAKARMEQFDKEHKALLTVKCRSDFEVPNPTEIRSLYIDQYIETIDASISVLIANFTNLESISFSSRYQGNVHPEIINTWLSILPKVRKLTFGSHAEYSITWSELASIDLSRIEVLNSCIENNSQPIPLKAPVLTEFTLFGTYEEELSLIEKCCLERTPYDFSAMPSLRKVKLSRCGFWDYKSLACLHELETLDITDYNLMNLTWLSENYSLSTLNVSACVEDVSGIETQPRLESLYLGCNRLSDVSVLGNLRCLRRVDLRGNNISDISPLERLEHLEYLNLERNPLISEGGLRNKGIRTLLVNPQDKSTDGIDRVINGFSQQVHWWLKNEDTRDVSQLPEWQRNAVLKNRQKPYEERLMAKIQAAFEQEFQRINPFDLWVDDLSVDLRAEYIRRASEKYPFLKVTPDMQSVLQRENSCIITRIPAVPGISFFSNEDFVRVYVKVKSGSGQIKQEYDKRYYRHSWMVNSRKIETAVKKNWDLFFPNKKLTELDFEITYAPLYGKEVDAKIAYAVLYAMWSAVYQIVLPQKTAVLLKCSGTGRLNKEEATLRQINVSRKQRIENIISWTPKKKAVRHSTPELTLFNTLEEFVADLYRQEKAHNRFKDLDSFRLKLVDVIQQHISDIADQRRIQAVLRDFFPDKKKDVNILSLLLQMNILEKIKSQPNIDGFFVSKFVSMLENDYAIGSEAARYAVHTWCLCYGKYILDKPCDL